MPRTFDRTGNFSLPLLTIPRHATREDPSILCDESPQPFDIFPIHGRDHIDHATSSFFRHASLLS